MTPAAVAVDVAYSLLLDGSGLPAMIAHDAFLRALDEPEAESAPNADDAATKETKRAALAAGIAARGEDAHAQFAGVGRPS